MKKYTPEALEIIYQYYGEVEPYLPEVLGKSKAELTAGHYYDWLTDATCEMMLGSIDDLIFSCAEFFDDYSIQYLQYLRIRPYAKALGVRFKRFARVCREGDYGADLAIDELVELITDALLQGINDNWEYLTSDEY